MVFLAVSIPVLARDEKSLFNTSLVAHGNNCHTLARAVNHVAAALFTVHNGNVEERLKEFLAVSSHLFVVTRVHQEASTSPAISWNREGVETLKFGTKDAYAHDCFDGFSKNYLF